MCSDIETSLVPVSHNSRFSSFLCAAFFSIILWSPCSILCLHTFLYCTVSVRSSSCCCCCCRVRGMWESIWLLGVRFFNGCAPRFSFPPYGRRWNWSWSKQGRNVGFIIFTWHTDSHSGGSSGWGLGGNSKDARSERAKEHGVLPCRPREGGRNCTKLDEIEWDDEREAFLCMCVRLFLIGWKRTRSSGDSKAELCRVVKDAGKYWWQNQTPSSK